MSIIRVGTTKKYADGWDAIFGGNKKPAKKAATSGKKARGKRTRRKK